MHGGAAGEFIGAQAGHEPTTDEERALRIATFVHMYMSRGGDQRVAVALVKAVARDGLEEGAKICTARKR